MVEVPAASKLSNCFGKTCKFLVRKLCKVATCKKACFEDFVKTIKFERWPFFTIQDSLGLLNWSLPIRDTIRT